MNKFKTLIVVGILGFAVIQTGWADSNIISKTPFDAEKWVGKWVKIWNTYDLDQVDELFLQDNRLTYFSSEKEGAIIGIEKIREHHRGFGFVPGGKEQPNKLWVKDLHAVEFDSSAVVTGIWYFQRADGSKQRGPVTIVYIQQGDMYLIAHMNFSNYQDEENK
jgi:hypothetical protein